MRQWHNFSLDGRGGCLLLFSIFSHLFSLVKSLYPFLNIALLCSQIRDDKMLPYVLAGASCVPVPITTQD